MEMNEYFEYFQHWIGEGYYAPCQEGDNVIMWYAVFGDTTDERSSYCRSAGIGTPHWFSENDVETSILGGKQPK
jgi:hypothetical protein